MCFGAATIASNAELIPSAQDVAERSPTLGVALSRTFSSMEKIAEFLDVAETLESAERALRVGREGATKFCSKAAPLGTCSSP